jgi:hypothetical protein
MNMKTQRHMKRGCVLSRTVTSRSRWTRRTGRRRRTVTGWRGRRGGIAPRRGSSSRILSTRHPTRWCEWVKPFSFPPLAFCTALLYTSTSTVPSTLLSTSCLFSFTRYDTILSSNLPCRYDHLCPCSLLHFCLSVARASSRWICLSVSLYVCVSTSITAFRVVIHLRICASPLLSILVSACSPEL